MITCLLHKVQGGDCVKNNIKAAREKQGLTQQECAELFNVKLRAWQTYEQGVSEPKFEVLCKIADKFGVTTDYLLGRENGDFFGKTKEEKDADIIKRLMALSEAKRNIAYDALVSFVDALENSKESNKNE